MDSKTGDEGSFEQLLKEAARQPSWLAPGASLLGGRFAIKRLLGSGGMGVVYEATDKERDATVALKLLSEVDASGIYRLKQEFRALVDVVHPNLVGLHELFNDRDQWFFTMELIEGDNFVHYIREVNGFDEGKLRDALSQLATAVSVIHRAGKLHRDLKPFNVLVTRKGRVKVLDFGLVSDHDMGGVGQTLTQDSVSGTPAYMAPEQAAGKGATQSSDIYAIGAMLYEVLTGRLPFEGSLVQVLAWKQQRDPLPPSELAEVPADFNYLCQQLLHRNPEQRPSLAEIAERLGTTVPPPVALNLPAEEEAPFVGRNTELSSLREAYGSARKGQPSTVLVRGLSGMGKTALVEHFLRELRSRGEAVILEGRCYEREAVPYKAVDSVIDALSRYLRQLSPVTAAALLPRHIRALTRIFPVLQRVEAIAQAPGKAPSQGDPIELRRIALSALKQLLATIADSQPLVLFIDDLQWGDLDSGRLLLELGAPPDPPSALFIVAYRSDEAERSPCLKELLEAERHQVGTSIQSIDVEGLPAEDVRALVAKLIGNEEQQRATAIATEAQGSPYFVHELARSTHEIGDSKAALSLDQVLGDRIAALEPEEQILLETIAVAGRPLALEIALRAAEAKGDSRVVLGKLTAGRLTRGIQTEEGEQLQCYHDRVREAVIAGLSDEQARGCHLRLAQSFDAVGEAHTEAVVEHLAAGGDTLQAAEHALEAAPRAFEQLAFDRAARLYEQGLSWSQLQGGERRSLLTKLAEALRNAGRGTAAGRAYLEAAQSASENEMHALRCLGADQLLLAGHIDEGLAILKKEAGAFGLKIPETQEESAAAVGKAADELIARGLDFKERPIGEIPDRDLQAIDLCWSIGWGIDGADSGATTTTFYFYHLHRALDAGERTRIIRGLCLLVGILSALGNPEAARVLRRLENRFAGTEDPYERVWLESARAVFHMWHGRARSALRYLRRAEEACRNSPKSAGKEIGLTRSIWLSSLLDAGEIREARARYPNWLREAIDREDRFTETSIRIRSVYCHLADDRPDIAEAENDAAKERWARSAGDQMWFNHFIAGIHVEMYRNGVPDWPRVLNTIDWFLAGSFAQNNYARMVVFTVRAQAALVHAKKASELEPFLRQAESDADTIEKQDLPTFASNVPAIRAAIAHIRGYDERVLLKLDRAALLCDGPEGNRLQGAYIWRRKGELIGGDEGRRLIEEGNAYMRDQGIKNPDRWIATFMPGFD